MAYIILEKKNRTSYSRLLFSNSETISLQSKIKTEILYEVLKGITLD